MRLTDMAERCTTRASSVAQATASPRSVATPWAQATVIDLRGYTVFPGWIDTHVHLDSHFDRTGRIATETEPPLRRRWEWRRRWVTLMGGFTTVQTVGDPAEKPLRDVIRDRGFPGPRVLTSLGRSKATRPRRARS